jgi:acyl-CoA thioesterase-1
MRAMTLRRRTLLAAGLAPLMAACRRRPKLPSLAPGDTVLALGDSITFGTGAAAGSSYPDVLASLTGWKVVNAGVPGDTSAGALARLPGLLQEHAPRLVLVSIGGNDFLRRLSEAETRANVRKICELAAAAAPVVLVGIPQFSVISAVARSLSDHPLYEDIAKDLKLPLHGGGWASVLGDPTLRSDPIHANEKGYAQFAKGLAATLKDVGLLKG